MSIRLYVGNLPEDVDRQAVEDLFTAAGEVISTKLIRDRKTNKCRGFGFVTVATQEQADQFIEKFNGYSFGDVTLRLELAQPRGKDEAGESDAPPVPRPEKADRSESGEKPQGSDVKKRGRGGRSQDKPTVVSTTSSGPTQPDPRWASQLQRIKEQLQAASQP